MTFRGGWRSRPDDAGHRGFAHVAGWIAVGCAAGGVVAIVIRVLQESWKAPGSHVTCGSTLDATIGVAATLSGVLPLVAIVSAAVSLLPRDRRVGRALIAVAVAVPTLLIAPFFALTTCY